MKQALTAAAAGMGILVLILDGRTALAGAQAGIDLCIRTVIPSLFPFFLLSILFTGALSGTSLLPFRLLGKLCGVPEGGEAILLTGFLGGYPTGAQAAASAWRSGQLSRDSAQRLLGFCSNAGPAFLFGMAAPLFSKPYAALLLWAIHIAGAVLTAQLLPPCEQERMRPSAQKAPSPSDAMHTALGVMGSVCGWVVLFRVILSFLDRWFLWRFPVTLRCIVSGLLELSNGCCNLYSISDEGLRFVLCSGMLAWGGICVLMQTSSVTDGLSLMSYIRGKLLQTLFSLLLSAAVVLKIWVPVSVILLVLAILLGKMKNRGRNPAAVGV